MAIGVHNTYKWPPQRLKNSSKIHVMGAFYVDIRVNIRVGIITLN